MNKKQVYVVAGGTHSQNSNTNHICEIAFADEKIGETLHSLLTQRFAENANCEKVHTKQFSKHKKGFETCTNHELQNAFSHYVGPDRIVVIAASLCSPDSSTPKEKGIETRPYAEEAIAHIKGSSRETFVVAYKQTQCTSTEHQYKIALTFLRKTKINLVLCFDSQLQVWMVVAPEEATYHVTTDRMECFKGLVDMIWHRCQNTYVRTNVIVGDMIQLEKSSTISVEFKQIMNHCMANHVFKLCNGITVGHFAYKLNDEKFYSSIRKYDHRERVVMTEVRASEDKIICVGGKPSAGVQVQRMIFKEHPELNCVLHFHCPLLPSVSLPTTSQREFDCGSLECAKNTLQAMRKAEHIWVAYSENHGPTLAFNHSHYREVMKFMDRHFCFDSKTGLPPEIAITD